MVGSFWQRPEVRWNDVLNGCLDSCARGDLLGFSSLVDAHQSIVQLHYHDFFSVGIENPHAEWFLMKLLQLDVHKNDILMGAIHMNYLRNLHTSGYNGSEACVHVICQHYGPNSLQNTFDYHGTKACGFDPLFCVNTNNILIMTLKHAKRNYIDEGLALSLIKIYLDNGIDVNARYKIDDGKSAIHYAAANNLWDCVTLLLKYNADIDFVYEGITARSIIDSHQHHLLQQYKPCHKSNHITDSLFSYLYNNDEDQFVTLFKKSKSNNIEFEESNGWYTLIQLATSKNLLQVVKTVLEYGSNINKVSGLKDHPILIAAERGHFEMVFLLVKCNRTNCLVTGDHGDTVLHKLARSLSQNSSQQSFKTVIQIIEVLSKKNELDLNIRNKKNETVFKLFVEVNHIELISFLLKKGAFLSADQSVLNDIHSSDLRSVLDSSISTHVNNKGYKIVNLDFECFNLLTNSKHQPEMLALYKLSKCNKHSKLLTHPLIKTFLHLKWLKIYWIYFINLLLFSVFVISLTSYICYSNSQIHAPFSYAMSIISYIYVFTREVLQLMMSPGQYLCTFENWLHIASLVFTFLLLAFGLNIFVVFNVLSIYMEFSLLLGRHPSIASYIAMFQKVSKVNILLLAISIPFIYSFAVCFSILFQSELIFQNPLQSLFITLIMSTGEFDLGALDFSKNPIVSEIVFLLFVVSIHIILMNLLHALAVHDTEGIQKDAELVSLHAKISLYSNIEAAWHGFPIKWYSNSWGYSYSNSWLQINNKFKNFINISVLPISEENKFCISLHEGGKCLIYNEQYNSDQEIPINLYSGAKILQPAIKLITGVSIQTIFTDCHEKFENKSAEINVELQHIREELNALSDKISNELKELKIMVSYCSACQHHTQ